MLSSNSTHIPPRGVRGFTIIEVVIASAVMVLAISSSLIVLQVGMRAIDNARYTTLAGQILQSQMEKLRLLTWTQLVTDIDKGPFPTTANATLRNPDYFVSCTAVDPTSVTNLGPTTSWFTPDVSTSTAASQLNNFKVNGVGNRCLQTMSAAPESNYASNIRIITLTAAWTGSDGRSHSLTYTTRYGKNGISDFFSTSHTF